MRSTSTAVEMAGNTACSRSAAGSSILMLIGNSLRLVKRRSRLQRSRPAVIAPCLRCGVPDVADGAGESAELEPFAMNSLGGSAETSPKFGIGDDAGQRAGKAVDITGGDKQAGNFIGDDVLDGADRRRDDSKARGHAFDDRDRQDFGVR